MEDSALDQVRRLLERLSSAEQAHLLSVLALRIACKMETTAHGSGEPAESVRGWECFFHIGDNLAAGEPQESVTMTAALLATRR